MGGYVEKDLHECKKTKPFEMMEGYHYYNPSIYSMGLYYNGQNKRQMKRYSYIIWRLGYAYENLYKYSLLYGSTELIDNMLKVTRELCVHANTVYEQLCTFKEETDKGRLTGKTYRYLGPGEKSIRHMPIEIREERTRNMKFLRNLDEWGHKTVEIVTIEDFEKYWPSFIDIFLDDARLFVDWGHWLTYLFESDLESGEESELDLHNLNELIQKGKKFANILTDFRMGVTTKL